MRRSRGGSWAPCWTPCPPAATWSPRTRRRSSTRTTVPRPRRSTTSGGSRSSSGSRTSCPSWRSAAWTWSTRVWCRSRSGARRATARARCQPRSPGTAGWRASPRIPGQWSHEWQPRDREPGLMRPGIDTTKPHTARIYDYYLSGKDNFAADRRTAERAMESWPAVRTAVRENRAFLGRAVRYLVSEAGIRQFLDIGTGLPSANNVHEVAQAAAPESRVVYVDNDPIVLSHARALLTSAQEGRTAYIDADLRAPEKILASLAVGKTLDLNQPVALSSGCLVLSSARCSRPAWFPSRVPGWSPADRADSASSPGSSPALRPRRNRARGASGSPPWMPGRSARQARA